MDASDIYKHIAKMDGINHGTAHGEYAIAKSIALLALAVYEVGWPEIQRHRDAKNFTLRGGLREWHGETTWE
jgi:hypothetical protein